MTQNKCYNATAAIFYGNSTYYQLPNVKTFRTLENEFYKPEPIDNESISIMYDSYSATIHWKPAKGILNIAFVHTNFHELSIYLPISDMVCHYLLKIYDLDTYQHELIVEKILTNVNIDNLISQ